METLETGLGENDDNLICFEIACFSALPLKNINVWWPSKSLIDAYMISHP